MGGASRESVGRPVTLGEVPVTVADRHGHHAVADRHGPQPGAEHPARGGDLDQVSVGASPWECRIEADGTHRSTPSSVTPSARCRSMRAGQGSPGARGCVRLRGW
ncbi:hypothetical protein BIU87_06620 [Streptomyces sp. ZS0098]|nr:hypothetical protein BIU87_06620 [Streptomyces sp. ZS0098]